MTGIREVAFEPLSRIYAEDLKSSWPSITFLLLTILCGSLLASAGPYVFSRLIDDLPDAPRQWMLGFSFYAGLTALATAIQRSTQYMSVIHSERLEYVATTRFFERIVHKNASFFNDHNPAEIQAAQTRGASAASAIMQIGLIYFVPGLATFLFSTLLLGAVLSADLVAIVILYGAAFIALTLASNRLTSPFLEKAIEAGQQNAGFCWKRHQHDRALAAHGQHGVDEASLCGECGLDLPELAALFPAPYWFCLYHLPRSGRADDHRLLSPSAALRDRRALDRRYRSLQHASASAQHAFRTDRAIHQ
ncbi:ABC transporter transmembrane domain-containing protein [Agrobacterium sp. FDAARGOS_525]|uniref:ABC transporter transmembrane domain-containing protein n=1 Tax=Agrobacterium sp. FDAARGOS_525 TaxID=2420311 RepID=UPI00256F5C3C|nr:ABC transporter transmembrane domain-containing protein [Agrobacterium sp. FDAARGOS_525]